MATRTSSVQTASTSKKQAAPSVDQAMSESPNPVSPMAAASLPSTSVPVVDINKWQDAMATLSNQVEDIRGSLGPMETRIRKSYSVSMVSQLIMAELDPVFGDQKEFIDRRMKESFDGFMRKLDDKIATATAEIRTELMTYLIRAAGLETSSTDPTPSRAPIVSSAPLPHPMAPPPPPSQPVYPSYQYPYYQAAGGFQFPSASGQRDPVTAGFHSQHLQRSVPSGGYYHMPYTSHAFGNYQAAEPSFVTSPAFPAATEVDHSEVSDVAVQPSSVTPVLPEKAPVKKRSAETSDSEKQKKKIKTKEQERAKKTKSKSKNNTKKLLEALLKAQADEESGVDSEDSSGSHSQ